MQGNVSSMKSHQVVDHSVSLSKAIYLSKYFNLPNENSNEKG